MADRAVWQRTIVDERGNIIPGAEVTVRSYPGGSLVTLYESPEGAPKSNPFVTGHDGFARFWADSQRVEIVAIGAGGSIRWIVDLINADEVIGDAVTEATAAAAVAVGEAEAAADRAEAARDAAQLNAGIYPDTAAGLAATSDGDYFSVPSESDDEYLILYRNDNGSATEIRRYPSAEALDAATQRVDDLASSEELQSIRVIEGADYSVAFTDSQGNVAGGFDEQGRFVARIGQQVEQYETKQSGRYSVAFANAHGAVALGINRQGGTEVNSLSLPGYDVIVAPNPGIAIAFADAQGRASRLIYSDGSEAPSGGGGPPVPEPHEVIWSFAEPIDDPSRELFLTWLSTSPNGTTLEYQPRGAGAWVSVTSFRTRPFPELDGLWLHTVRLQNLTPDTIYDFRILQTFYSDAVKTCPTESDIKISYASDWQNIDYSETSNIRVLGDIAASNAPDLIIFNGDLNNSNGEYSEEWAEDYLEIFRVFHDHWRGPDGVQVPWLFTYGNHEGSGGVLGMIQDICSWSIVEHEGRLAPSIGTVRVGELLSIIATDSGYFTSLDNQLSWFSEQLSEHATETDHSLVITHVSPFNTLTDPVDYTRGIERRLRNQFWTAAQQYSGSGGSIRAWLSAHTHQMLITGKLKMAYDPEDSDEVNDLNFYRDPEGIINLGMGPVGGSSLRTVWDDTLFGMVSNIDGQPFWDAAITRSDTDPSTYKVGGDITNPRYPVSNIWILELKATEWTATSLNLDGDPFYSHQEILE